MSDTDTLFKRCVWASLVYNSGKTLVIEKGYAQVVSNEILLLWEIDYCWWTLHYLICFILHIYKANICGRILLRRLITKFFQLKAYMLVTKCSSNEFNSASCSRSTVEKQFHAFNQNQIHDALRKWRN